MSECCSFFFNYYYQLVSLQFGSLDNYHSKYELPPTFENDWHCMSHHEMSVEMVRSGWAICHAGVMDCIVIKSLLSLVLFSFRVHDMLSRCKHLPLNATAKMMETFSTRKQFSSNKLNIIKIDSSSLRERLYIIFALWIFKWNFQRIIFELSRFSFMRNDFDASSEGRVTV